MPVRLHVLEDLGNLAVFVDHEGGAGDALHDLAVHVLVFDHVELFADFLVDVGQERVRQVVFLLEFFLLGRSVGGDAVDERPGLADLVECVAEPARFDRSTRGVSLRVEEQDNVFPAQRLQSHGFPVLVLECEFRCLRAFC